MDKKNYYEILEINKNATQEDIKKSYRKLSLLHHPDKNDNSPESNKKFKEIKESYDYLQQIIDSDTDSIDSDDSIKFNNNNTSNYYDTEITLYTTILHIFIDTVFNNPQKNKIIYQIITDIVSNVKKISLALFEQLDKETLIDIYLFLDKYRIILHIKDAILDEIKKIVEEKYANIEIYKLNPNIDDLLNNHLYKLCVDNKFYYVPLWKRENYFDIESNKTNESNESNEIIVICEPEIPDNIKIDCNSNIHTQYVMHISDLKQIITENIICIQIGNTYFQIPVEKLHIKKEQLFIFQGKGLTIDNSDSDSEFDNINERADIIVKIIMLFE